MSAFAADRVPAEQLAGGSGGLRKLRPAARQRGGEVRVHGPGPAHRRADPGYHIHYRLPHSLRRRPQDGQLPKVAELLN